MTSRPSPEGEDSIHQLVSAVSRFAEHGDGCSELHFLNEIVRMLPAAVTVQDEHGQFLLVNDAASAQFMTPAKDFLRGSAEISPSTNALNKRRDNGNQLLKSGRSVVAEERVVDSRGDRAFLTAH